MVVKIKFDNDFEFDYIYYPDFFKFNVDNFFKWLYENKSHPFWVYDENGELEGVDYRSDALVYWINECINDFDNKAYIIKEYTRENIDYDLIVSL